jgi:hypothetical protein
MLKKLVLTVFLFLLTPGLSHAQTEYDNDVISQLTLDFFVSACFLRTDQLPEWADNNQTLAKTEIQDPQSFKTIGVRYGYPKEEDDALNMWNISGTYIVLLQMANRGCSVISDAVITPETFSYWLESFAQYTEEQTGVKTGVMVKEGEIHDVTNFLLTVNAGSEGNKIYILTKLYPKSTGGSASTRIFYFESVQDVEL